MCLLESNQSPLLYLDPSSQRRMQACHSSQACFPGFFGLAVLAFWYYSLGLYHILELLASQEPELRPQALPQIQSPSTGELCILPKARVSVPKGQRVIAPKTTLKSTDQDLNNASTLSTHLKEGPWRETGALGLPHGAAERLQRSASRRQSLAPSAGPSAASCAQRGQRCQVYLKLGKSSPCLLGVGRGRPGQPFIQPNFH